MICSTFGDISCFNYTKKLRIQMLQKLQKYNNSVNMNILEAWTGTHDCENQKLNSALARRGLWLISELLLKILAIILRETTQKLLWIYSEKIITKTPEETPNVY